MKRVVYIILLILIILNLNSCTLDKVGQDYNETSELVYEDIVDKIIRFHIIANSNSKEDQELKLLIRDRVINFVSNDLSKNKNIEESRKYLIKNKEKIENIAKDTIKESGYTYNVTSALSKENFPDKVYGDVIFPQGEYEAYRILIGEAKGENWWCVMFPPLCFVDETKEAVDSTEFVNSLEENNTKEQNDDEEYHVNKDANMTKRIKFKFKIFEILFGDKS